MIKNQQTDNLIDKIVHCILSHYSVDAIYLYGSQATGRTHPMKPRDLKRSHATY